MSVPTRHLRAVPQVEPSTDFPALDDIYQPTAASRRARGWTAAVVALVVLAAVAIGAIGFVSGRASAPVPSACLQALNDAEIAFTGAAAQFGTIEQSALAVIDGELPEAYAVLSDARFGAASTAQIQARFDAVAAACRG